MLKFYFNKRILAGFILALAILSWLAVSSYLNTKNLISSSRMVAHTLDVLYNTQRVLAIVTNIELGQRGYSLTGNEEFLQPYTKGQGEVDVHLKNLKNLVNDNPAQQKRIRELFIHIQRLREFTSDVIADRKVSFENAREVNASLKGKRLMDTIRSLISEIEREENVLLKTRGSINEKQIQSSNLAFIVLLTATSLILILIYFGINFNLKARIDAEKKLQMVSTEIKDLYDNAPCGYHSLDSEGRFVNINNTLLHWLGYTKEETLGKLKFTDVIVPDNLEFFKKVYEEFKVTGTVSNLEFNLLRRDGSEFPVLLSAAALRDSDGNYVKSRATTFDNTERKRAETRIKNLNHELEAFTYSVSHDLRAPLRSIDGYSKILQEDYTDKLDDEGKRVIRVIMSNAKRMGKLIDDLLDFARLGRKDMLRSNLNMTQFVNSIAQDLKAQESDRNITIKIEPLLSASVDVDMIRQVWENLLSNAIKYTGKATNAVIEVSSFETGYEIGYCVKDNGVGFDMQYGHKLFGVFQRLHKVQDFSGTGVGLAIVKRIVERHNGRAWAEGKPNEGAAFYFTIPKQ